MPVTARSKTRNSAQDRDRRRFSRVHSSMASLAICLGHEAQILDISSNGVQLQFAGEAPKGDVTQVAFPQLSQTLACEIMWRDGDKLGLRFTEKPYEISARFPVGLRIRLLDS